MLPDAGRVLFAVNINRYLPKLPAISVSQLNDKQLQKEHEKNAFQDAKKKTAAFPDKM